MSSRTPQKKFQDRLIALDRRYRFLSDRIDNYTGKNNSRDKAEASAINWATKMIRRHPELALEVIIDELWEKK